MNFLEAYSKLDILNHSLLQYTIPPAYKYTKTKGVCPGCKTTHKSQEEYERHVIKDCAKAKSLFDSTNMPARIKVGKAEHSFDILTNITEKELIDYMVDHQRCEICGGVGVHPDHRHSKDGTHSGTFRGVLCDDCNLLLGRLESEFRGLSYDDYLLKIKWYLDRGEEWTSAAKAGFTQPDLMYAEDNF